jgi:hypothetical protein
MREEEEKSFSHRWMMIHTDKDLFDGRATAWGRQVHIERHQIKELFNFYKYNTVILVI